MAYTQSDFNTWSQQRAFTDLAEIDAPLADLDTSKYSYASFIYPMDLGAPGTGKDHYMVFHINETSTTSFTTRGTGAVDQQNPMGKNLAAGEMSTNQKNGLVDQANNEGNSVALNSHTADPQGTSNIGTSGQGAVQTAVAGIKQPVTRIATTIVLYMPPEIKVKYDADWAATDLGLAADLTNALKGSGTWGDFWKSMGASAGQQAGERLNDLTNMKIKESLSRAGRMVINSHAEVIFNGIGFRDFQFSFRFTPDSEDEALNVDNIIRAFKFYSAPEVLQGTAGRFWIYPAEFDIQYYSNGKENNFLNKISTCALTSMEVNYTPMSHFAAHRPHSVIQGSPSVCVDMHLSFKELEIMTKRRILEGY